MLTYTADPSAGTFRLRQHYRVAELAFAVALLLPGIFLAVVVAEDWTWRILSLITFTYLAGSNLPPTASTTVSADGTIHFERRDAPVLVSPHVFDAPTSGTTRVALRRVPVRELRKSLAGYQLLVVFEEGFAVPTSDTLVVGDANIAALREAGTALAKVLKVEFVEEEVPAAADGPGAAAPGSAPGSGPGSTSVTAGASTNASTMPPRRRHPPPPGPSDGNESPTSS
ncbi:hypothetical protein BC828DRAFT_390114 [Blastocladiella britannica]|nr:hypothetical protein BC828DRAFT_390114 [Blastocladiella britannica]